MTTLAADTTEGPWPKLVFLHQWGWGVIKAGPNRYRLLWDGKFGCIATFTTLAAAVDYMNKEFLV